MSLSIDLWAPHPLSHEQVIFLTGLVVLPVTHTHKHLAALNCGTKELMWYKKRRPPEKVAQKGGPENAQSKYRKRNTAGWGRNHCYCSAWELRWLQELVWIVARWGERVAWIESKQKAKATVEGVGMSVQTAKEEFLHAGKVELWQIKREWL